MVQTRKQKKDEEKELMKKHNIRDFSIVLNRCTATTNDGNIAQKTAKSARENQQHRVPKANANVVKPAKRQIRSKSANFVLSSSSTVRGNSAKSAKPTKSQRSRSNSCDQFVPEMNGKMVQPKASSLIQSKSKIYFIHRT